MKRRGLSVAAAGALLGALSACGGSSGSTIGSPCDLATKSDVQTAFGFAVSDGVVGNAKNCHFEPTSPQPGIVAVEVYLYEASGGTADWNTFRQGFVDNRGGVTDVAGVGDKAFYPGDVGPNEIDGLSGDVLFGVGSSALGPVDRAAETLALAKVVAAHAKK